MGKLKTHLCLTEKSKTATKISTFPLFFLPSCWGWSWNRWKTALWSSLFGLCWQHQPRWPRGPPCAAPRCEPNPPTVSCPDTTETWWTYRIVLVSEQRFGRESSIYPSCYRLGHWPQALQLNKASKLHDAGDLAVVDVTNRRLLRWRPVHVFVLPAVRVSVLVLLGAGWAFVPPGRFFSPLPLLSVSVSFSVSVAIAISRARPGTVPSPPVSIIISVSVSVAVAISVSASAATSTVASALFWPVDGEKNPQQNYRWEKNPILICWLRISAYTVKINLEKHSYLLLLLLESVPLTLGINISSSFIAAAATFASSSSSNR